MHYLTENTDYTDLQIKEAWTWLSAQPAIAGPWVGFEGKCFRYNCIGNRLACASSQKEIELEDERLQNLGYLLTDKNRKIPPSWFFSFDETGSIVETDKCQNIDHQQFNSWDELNQEQV